MENRDPARASILHPLSSILDALTTLAADVGDHRLMLAQVQERHLIFGRPGPVHPRCRTGGQMSRIDNHRAGDALDAVVFVWSADHTQLGMERVDQVAR